MKVILKETEHVYIHNFTENRLYISFCFDSIDLFPLTPGINRFHFCDSSLLKELKRDGNHCKKFSISAPEHIQTTATQIFKVELIQVLSTEPKTQIFYVCSGERLPTLFELAKCRFLHKIDDVPFIEMEKPPILSLFVTVTIPRESYEVMIKSCSCKGKGHFTTTEMAELGIVPF
jgi:hypothetical protein